MAAKVGAVAVVATAVVAAAELGARDVEAATTVDGATSVAAELSVEVAAFVAAGAAVVAATKAAKRGYNSRVVLQRLGSVHLPGARVTVDLATLLCNDQLAADGWERWAILMLFMPSYVPYDGQPFLASSPAPSACRCGRLNAFGHASRSS